MDPEKNNKLAAQVKKEARGAPFNKQNDLKKKIFTRSEDFTPKELKRMNRK
jgi:hypothetical protein